MVRAAGFVIADALGKKGRGVEEAVERVLVVPLISRLDPGISAGVREEVVAPKKVGEKKEEKKSSSALLAFEDSSLQPAKSTSEAPSRRPLVAEVEDDTAGGLDTKPLVPEADLSSALHHLEILLSSQPSPTLPQRLISPILLPLWALTNFARLTGRNTWHERTLSLLKTYLKTSPDKSVLQRIQGRMLYSGGEGWGFGPGSEGGIEIRCRIGSAAGFDVGKAEARIQEFLELLEDGGVSGDVLNNFFLGNLRTWLGRRNSEGEDPVKMFTTLKILQEVLGGREEEIAKNPTEVLQIVKGVVDEHVEYLEGLGASGKGTITPSSEGLGKIVSNSPLPNLKDGGGEGEQGEEEERTQTLTMTLSLLSAIISNPTTKLTPPNERLIQTLQPALTHIAASKFTNSEIKTLTLNITSLLTLHSPSIHSSSSSSSTSSTALLTRQKETYKLALSYLHDPLIPVRAHGLHLLRELILEKSPVINIQTTLSQLITQLKDDDSFIHLNVIKCLSSLTDKHPKTATRMLIEAYLGNTNANKEEGEEGEEEGLNQDQTLRLAESLQSTIQRQGESLVGETAALLTQAALKATRENPNIQIRASALSLLCAAIETNPTGLGHGVISDALDICMAILTLEGAGEKAGLRRAAVVCVCGVLKTLVGDDGGVEWREGMWEVVKGRVSEIGRVVGYLGGTDMDGLVREQAGVVLENLEAVVEVQGCGSG
ncbi:hypothetical protein C7212DRAFT_284873 [Tuber magnatum]|uniref:RNA polymerase II assembly factor Rtp1 C-terminal domain-containing protein n=1 Tax=Tuber magnatum TaxID=42249 RepID=A0A317SFM6_9PEZI|nr:hypothetical protein C7212DRAFT_284873 [Tuber magnatum]